jgi:hypothetical protein
MTVKAWLEMATHDAERRGLPELKPLLEALAKATSALRTAEWNADATGDAALGPDPGSRPSTSSGRPEALEGRIPDPGRGR